MFSRTSEDPVPKWIAVITMLLQDKVTIIPGSHETSTSCPLVDMTQGKKVRRTVKGPEAHGMVPCGASAWLVVALKINAVQYAKRRINIRLSEMLTIIPYEGKPSQINKEDKNPYKEICQQKPQKNDFVPYLTYR
jgi:hypothetical protein